VRVKRDRRHCERSEAIQNLALYDSWIASSLALLAMTSINIPRRELRPGHAKTLVPPETEGAGNAG